MHQAMDVARTVLRHGSRNVTLFERGRVSAASERERSYAMIDGADIVYCKDTVEITEEGPIFRDIYYDDEGNVTRFLKNRVGFS